MHLTLCQTGIGRSRPPSEPWELLVPSSAVIAPMPHSSVCWQSRSPAPLSIDPTLLPLSKISQLRPRNLPDHQPPQQKYCHMLTCNAPSAALHHSWKFLLSPAIIHNMCLAFPISPFAIYRVLRSLAWLTAPMQMELVENVPFTQGSTRYTGWQGLINSKLNCKDNMKIISYLDLPCPLKDMQVSFFVIIAIIGKTAQDNNLW